MKVLQTDGPTPDLPEELHVTKRWRSAWWLLLSYQISQQQCSEGQGASVSPSPPPHPLRCFFGQCPLLPSTAHSVTITLYYEVERLEPTVLLIVRSIVTINLQ